MLKLLILVALVQQQPPTAAAVQALAAGRTNDRQLIAIARQHTDTLREAIRQSLQMHTTASSAPQTAIHLSVARRLAGAYAIAWQDSFLVRQVGAFERASRSQQLAKLRSDSLRLAGNAALIQRGFPAAQQLWRNSLREAVAARDSARQAAALGNVGAGYYRAQQLDSAELHLVRSRNLATRIGDRRTAANAIGILAAVRMDRGDLWGAAELFSAASALRAQCGDTRGQAADQNNLGLVARELGDLAGAADAFDRAFALNQQPLRPIAAATNLINLAGIAASRADYAHADSLYTDALRLQKEHGADAEVPYTLHERGLLRAVRGDYIGAATDLRTAVAAHDATGAALDAAAARSDLAAVVAAAGYPQNALIILRQAEAQARNAGADGTLLGAIALTRADLAADLNAFEEARDYYATAESQYRQAGDDYGLGRVAEGRARLSFERSDFHESLTGLQAAQKAYARAQDNRALALTQLSAAYAHLALNDPAAAWRAVRSADQTLRRVEDAIARAAVSVAAGDVQLARRAPATAERQYRTALQRLNGRTAPDVRWRAHAGLGNALRVQNKVPAAIEQYRAAVVAIERPAATLVATERRVGFMADKLDVYAQLALAERARGNVAGAFAASEGMRAQQLLAQIARARVGEGRPKPAREQDLRRQIAALTQAIEESADAPRATREVETRRNATLREALYGAQVAYTRLLTELRETDPAYAALARPIAASAQDVARTLATDEAFIEYLVTDSTVLAFVITDRRASLVDLSLTRGSLAPLIDFAVRVTQKPGQTSTASLWQAPFARLYDALLAPLLSAGHLAGKKSLVIVPHGELHFVPFAALLDRQQDKFVVERWVVSYAPSASVWTRMRAQRRPSDSRIVALAPRTDVLPFSRAEVEAVRRIYGRKARVLIGDAATQESMRAALPGAGVLHLATLGVLNKHNPLFSFVELGTTRNRRARLEVHDVFDLPLNGQLVILSACQTALGAGAFADVPAGDDWTGLVQSFIAAGAGAVVASLWPVNDRATATLMSSFHQRLRSGQGTSVALAQAQRAALRNPQTAHPFYWAAFTSHAAQ